MQPIAFSEDHVDVLRELINIAIGAATASIADLLDAFGTMHIPQVRVAAADELKAHIEGTVEAGERNYVTKQLFTGDFGGENLFVISETSAINLGNHIYDVEIPSEADMLDAVVELTNILSATIVGKLTQELDTQVQFFVPTTQLVIGPHIIDDEDLGHYQQVIVISTVMEFEDKQIEGQIYILTKDESVVSLKALIDRKLEALYG